MTTPAVFLDRDGTLIQDPGYLATPNDVSLFPGVAEALRLLEEAGFLRIAITNQSGIGRGYFTEAQYRLVASELDEQLAGENASLNATFFCPHTPAEGCLCRKPGTLLHSEAIKLWQIDPARSWCVGDRLTDLIPSCTLGCQAALVLTGDGAEHEATARKEGFLVSPSLLDLVKHQILQLTEPS